MNKHMNPHTATKTYSSTVKPQLKHFDKTDTKFSAYTTEHEALIPVYEELHYLNEFGFLKLPCKRILIHPA
ncbi:MAG: hypothetical protein VKJ06_02925 [Vampirovibrionales bacterium]|nr:hypothetical protein [Vampirovibrionales bacterium]